jgi:folate-binding protein YgfZ
MLPSPMARISPLRARHDTAGAEALCWGDPGADVQVVEAFGAIESEYGALRATCALLDLPHRGAISVTGADRIEFLNRMLTQELKGLAPGEVRFSFWLNRQGRIDADLRLGHYADRTLFDLDVHAAAVAAASLSEFLFSEDVQIEDVSESTHRLGLLGPGTPEVLAHVLAEGNAGGPAPAARLGLIGSAQVHVEREDSAGVPGFVLLMRAHDAPAVYEQLVEAGAQRIGWHAWNIARIEAGWPVFNIDFGPKNLPAETGILEQRVSFTKGCYLGQEVVARMHSRGKSKQRLAGLAPADMSGDRLAIAQPITGAQVFAAGDPGGDVLGMVTSSTISPAMGSAPVCFAMLRASALAPGTEVDVVAEDGAARMVVREGLKFV